MEKTVVLSVIENFTKCSALKQGIPKPGAVLRVLIGQFLTRQVTDQLRSMGLIQNSRKKLRKFNDLVIHQCYNPKLLIS